MIGWTRGGCEKRRFDGHSGSHRVTIPPTIERYTTVTLMTSRYVERGNAGWPRIKGYTYRTKERLNGPRCRQIETAHNGVTDFNRTFTGGAKIKQRAQLQKNGAVPTGRRTAPSSTHRHHLPMWKAREAHDTKSDSTRQGHPHTRIQGKEAATRQPSSPSLESSLSTAEHKASCKFEPAAPSPCSSSQDFKNKNSRKDDWHRNTSCHPSF